MIATESVLAIGDVPPVEHDEAIWMAQTEYRRLVSLLGGLDAAQWTAPTCCQPWTVRDLATHVLGYLRAASSPREMLRQIRLARRRPGVLVDAIAAVQVAELADLTPREITVELASLIPAAVHGRGAIPAPVRRLVKVPAQLPVSGARERWPLGFVTDVIGTRDVWMHRSDVCRAVGVEPELTADHDGRLVAAVVQEWARRMGRPVQVELSGPAGGAFRCTGPAEVAVEIDAVQFCRLLSGRDGAVPYGVEVPF